MQDSKGMTQMRIGLAVTKVTRNTGRNLHAMLEFIDEAARNEADLVLFGEAAPTGLITVSYTHLDVYKRQEFCLLC